MRVTPSKHGPFPPKPPHTPAQLGCANLIFLSQEGCILTQILLFPLGKAEVVHRPITEKPDGFRSWEFPLIT